MLKVFVRTVSGEVFQAFTFRGTEKAAIVRAHADAQRFGVEVRDVWCEAA